MTILAVAIKSVGLVIRGEIKKIEHVKRVEDNDNAYLVVINEYIKVTFNKEN